MINDIIIFNTMIFRTDTVTELFINATNDKNSLDMLIEINKLLDNVKNETDYKNLNNDIINKAIKEILMNKKTLKILETNTKLNIEILKDAE